jgi:hypothetical protein
LVKESNQPPQTYIRTPAALISQRSGRLPIVVDPGARHLITAVPEAERRYDIDETAVAGMLFQRGLEQGFTVLPEDRGDSRGFVQLHRQVAPVAQEVIEEDAVVEGDAVEVKQGDDREDGPEMRGTRGSGHELGDAQIRTPEHTHAAVAPGLRGEPFRDLVGVPGFLGRKDTRPCSERSARAADVSVGQDVAVSDEGLV